MSKPIASILSPEEIKQIHDASIMILRDTGVLVHNDEARSRLREAGARVSSSSKIVYMDEGLVVNSLNSAGKQFVLHGREAGRTAKFGFGEANMISSPGQFAWFDYETNQRRPPKLADARAAGLLGDALDNITIVGGMAAPIDVPEQIRDVILTAELIRQTGKPVRAFPVSRRSSRYVLEILKAVAGGSEALRERPMTEMLLEPISPLQLPEKELDIMLEFTACGQPISIGPMAMSSGTAPATLAGTLAQENAEILAGLVIVQTVAPGTPVLYGSIPHIMDPRTSICSFGSPEQGLLALALTQIGKSYHLPIYINVNLTDSKRLDFQTGIEKMGSMVLGMLAGADLFGHAGIVGADHGGSLSWLIADNEAASFGKRILKGFTIDEEHLAVDVIASVKPGGNYVSELHTVRHFRNELWIPGYLWTRDPYDTWLDKGEKDFEQRVIEKVRELLNSHTPPRLEPRLEQEIFKIVETARQELVG